MYPVKEKVELQGRAEMLSFGPLQGICLYPSEGGPAISLPVFLSTYQGRNIKITIEKV